MSTLKLFWRLDSARLQVSDEESIFMGENNRPGVISSGGVQGSASLSSGAHRKVPQA